MSTASEEQLRQRAKRRDQERRRKEREQAERAGVPFLSSEHAELLRAAAITAEFRGVRSAYSPELDLPDDVRSAWRRDLPGILFTHHGIDGSESLQLRPDRPRDPERKYLTPAGRPLVLDAPAIGGNRDRMLDPERDLVIVEGTKGHLAAATAAERDGLVAVVGLMGCWGASDGRGGWVKSLTAIPVKGRRVRIMLDADVASNRNVWAAGQALALHLSRVMGAKDVVFVAPFSTGTDSIDDVLGRVLVDDRADVFGRIVDEFGKLPKRPPTSSRWVVNKELRTAAVARALVSDLGEPRTSGGTLVFPDPASHAYTSAGLDRWLSQTLSNDWTAARAKEVVDFVRAEGVDELPVTVDEHVALFANGAVMLDEGTSHRDVWPTTTVFPVEWDPEATCPTYDAWTLEKLGADAEGLQRAAVRDEIFGSVFDLGALPRRHLINEGPSHTGKSTDINLLTAAAGAVAFDPHRIAGDRFAVAALAGHRLATCADLENLDMASTGLLKQICDHDNMTAQRKYGHQFSFRPTALLVLATNGHVKFSGETTRAILNRFATVRYGVTHAGREDPSVEAAMLAELPGIVRRWVAAYQRARVNGWTAMVPADRAAQEAGMNTVAQFIAECCEPDEEGTLRSTFLLDFRNWFRVEHPGTKEPGRTRTFEQVRSAGFPDARYPGGHPRAGGWFFPLKVRAWPDE